MDVLYQSTQLPLLMLPIQNIIIIIIIIIMVSEANILTQEG